MQEISASEMTPRPLAVATRDSVAEAAAGGMPARELVATVCEVAMALNTRGISEV